MDRQQKLQQKERYLQAAQRRLQVADQQPRYPTSQRQDIVDDILRLKKDISELKRKH